MGRLASKRRIKAIDPFSKTGGVARLSGNIKVRAANLAPKRGDEDSISTSKMMWMPGGAKPASFARAGASKRPGKRARQPTGSKAEAATKGTSKPDAAGTDTPAAAPAKTLMPQLERQPGESLRKFKRRLREAAKAAMMHNRDHQGGFRRVSESRRLYMSRKSNHEKNKLAAKLVGKAEKHPELGTTLLASIQGKQRYRTGSDDDSDSDDASSNALIPKDIAIEQAVLARGKTRFGDRAMAPPELRPTGRLARMLPGSRTATAAERMLLRAAQLSSTAAKAASSAGVDSGMWQGGLSRRETRAAATSDRKTLAATGDDSGDDSDGGGEAMKHGSGSQAATAAKAGGLDTRRAEAGNVAKLNAAREASIRAYAAMRQRRSETVRRAAGNASGATRRAGKDETTPKRARPAARQMLGGSVARGSLAMEHAGAGLGEFDM